MGGKWSYHRPCYEPMDMLRRLVPTALILGLTSCSAGACQLPSGWKLATAMEPPNVIVARKLELHSKETSPGQWSWRAWGRGETIIAYQKLLTELAAFNEFDPQPLFLFSFSEGHSCRELNDIRAGIAKAAKCSANAPCIEGTPDELP